MEQGIIDFYEGRGFQVYKLVDRNPKHLPADRIYMAMSDVYAEVQSGRQIPTVQIAREVWRKAFDYADEEINYRLKLIHLNLEALRIVYKIRRWVKEKYNVSFAMLRRFFCAG